MWRAHAVSSELLRLCNLTADQINVASLGDLGEHPVPAHGRNLLMPCRGDDIAIARIPVRGYRNHVGSLDSNCWSDGHNLGRRGGHRCLEPVLDHNIANIRRIRLLVDGDRQFPGGNRGNKKPSCFLCRSDGNQSIIAKRFGPGDQPQQGMRIENNTSQLRHLDFRMSLSTCAAIGFVRSKPRLIESSRSFKAPAPLTTDTCPVRALRMVILDAVSLFWAIRANMIAKAQLFKCSVGKAAKFCHFDAFPVGSC